MKSINKIVLTFIKQVVLKPIIQIVLGFFEYLVDTSFLLATKQIILSCKRKTGKLDSGIFYKKIISF